MTEFECKGYWYLPDDEERRIAGILYISKKGELSLDLFGTLTDAENGDIKSHRIVLGSVEKSPCGNEVTLTGCMRIAQHVGSHIDSREEYRASRGYFGAHLKEEYEFSFTSFMTKLEGLNEWASSLSGLNREPYQLPTSKKRGETIPIATYRVPTTPEGKVLNATISLNMGVTSQSGLHEFTFREVANIYADLDEPRSAEKINGEYIYPLQNLMSFVSDSAQEMESFSVWRTKDSDPYENPEIRVIGPRVHPDLDEDKRKSTRSDQMLFTLADLIDVDFATFLERWLQMAKTHSTAFSIYFGIQYGPPSYIDMTYMLVSQVLSLYYAKTEAGIEHRHEEERRLKETLHVARKDADWIIEHLGVKPYPTFKSVLRELVVQCGDVIDPIISKRRDAFINQAVNTLQYIERRSSEDYAAACQGSELFWLMNKLRFLIKACFLRELGFSTSKIIELFNRNEYFQHIRKLESYLELERDSDG